MELCLLIKHFGNDYRLATLSPLPSLALALSACAQRKSEAQKRQIDVANTRASHNINQSHIAL